jgi:hypothetical protein
MSSPYGYNTTMAQIPFQSPNPSEEVNFFHLNSDKDAGPTALHHTLGLGPGQASPGNHNHDGRNSLKIKLSNVTWDNTSIPFTVVFGTTGTQPTFTGAPLVTGSYTRWGNMCHFQIDVDMDNITNFGTGEYYVDLPFNVSHPYQFRDGCLHDISTGRNYSISGHVAVGQKRLYLFTTDSQGNRAFDAAFTSTVPVTLAVADNFHIAGTYEIQQ